MGRPANLLIVIPARLAATRLPRKPLDVRLDGEAGMRIDAAVVDHVPPEINSPYDLARLGATYLGAA